MISPNLADGEGLDGVLCSGGPRLEDKCVSSRKLRREGRLKKLGVVGVSSSLGEITIPRLSSLHDDIQYIVLKSSLGD